ncbi:TetR family transcriptional regulator [Streptomyces fagopyri]|uniref:TetR family transcriptional regulator n=1 Tax=Streptomyces fagopyri TaxID=2662397 RepID=A0A5Q0L619_9ACTN|nr:TetR/AcrR family transcriptional regulator [Streptomyces fagopyri]QFZ72176.1 TetR family transcriptional regulator [Streptomyces fagopyri]
MDAGAPKPGLRDRKRAETRARIEAAAVELVLSDGLEAATVDAISERADISPRTFFNYFESKDAAVLGVRPKQADEDVMTAQLSNVDELDPVVAVIHVVMATMGITESVEAGLHRRRLEIIRRYPDIVAGQFAQLNARRDRLAGHVSQILARRASRGGETGPDSQAHGAIVLALCASAVRSAVLDWAENAETGEDAPGPGIRDAEVIEQRALALVRTTLRRLA